MSALRPPQAGYRTGFATRGRTLNWPRIGTLMLNAFAWIALARLAAFLAHVLWHGLTH